MKEQGQTAGGAVREIPVALRAPSISLGLQTHTKPTPKNRTFLNWLDITLRFFLLDIQLPLGVYSTHLKASSYQTEHQKLANRRVVNDGFLDYKILSFPDIPEMEITMLETGDPFGAKGIGEAGLVPTAAAIANAIYNASGIRVTELPITREFILKNLKEKVSEN